MKCKVDMTRTSKNDPATNMVVTYIGEVAEKEGRMAFRYTEAESNAHCMIIYENESVHIRRVGEVESDFKLKVNEKSVANIKTPYGTMDMEIKTYKIKTTPTILEVGYRIIEGNKIVDDIHIKWSIRKEGIS